MAKFGYREFALADDIFTSDPAWAKQVSQALIETGIDMAWTCTNGIRVESADAELFRVMRAAGCYRVSFGFESGNDAVLKAFGKGGKASIEKGCEAVKLTRGAGIDTNGYFMLGLSPDTESTMTDTIEYARKRSLDMMKFGISIAFPGTPMFKEYRQKGLVRSYNWDEYFIYTTKALFAHPNLSFDKVTEFAGKAYWRAVLTNPRVHPKKAVARHQDRIFMGRLLLCPIHFRATRQRPGSYGGLFRQGPLAQIRFQKEQDHLLPAASRQQQTH